MERSEYVRERHRPDWIPIFLGTVVNFALMGMAAMFGGAFRLLDIHPGDSIALIVIELLWLLGSVAFGSFCGGFVAGYTQSTISQVSAVLNGLLITQLSIILFFVQGLFGYPILPGVTFSLNPGGSSSEGLIWWAMMISLPDLFATSFGAIMGNKLAGKRNVDKGLKAPEESPESSYESSEERAA